MQAATTSPFASAGESFGEAWVLWQKRHQPEPESPPPPVPEEVPLPRPIYHHRQYDAVIRRMKTAQQQTGSYSAWPSS